MNKLVLLLIGICIGIMLSFIYDRVSFYIGKKRVWRKIKTDLLVNHYLDRY
ncbi:hypothetical protein [Vallitalea maricola]|uniref:Uncharacterized protein n=1 Tax=Vallitalea maricola TaxID=3074433 RepID=A0ACB5UL82_9FIRM|nr:hypothetical protein AN2V17_28510 [Vallitalea sp. AN17-2]